MCLKRMQRDALGDPGVRRRAVAGAIELTGRHRIDRVLPREQPSPGQHLAPRLGLAPPGPQQREQGRGQHRVAVPAPLPLLNANGHALAVDVPDLQRHHLRGAQTRPVGHRQRRLVLQPRGRVQQPGDLLDAQDHRQGPFRSHMAGLRRQLGVSEGHLAEEPQRRHRRVQTGSAHTAVGQVQLVAAQVLRRGRCQGPPQEGGELPHGADVARLGLLRELAQAHVFDHALAQRADSLGVGGHGLSSCRRG